MDRCTHDIHMMYLKNVIQNCQLRPECQSIMQQRKATIPYWNKAITGNANFAVKHTAGQKILRYRLLISQITIIHLLAGLLAPQFMVPGITTIFYSVVFQYFLYKITNLDGLGYLYNYLNPSGFLTCHLQESSHISSIPNWASQPNSRFALLGSA